MISAAQSRGARKAIRDIFQATLAVIAAGGATAGLEVIVADLNPAYSVLLGIAFKVMITYAQNYLETSGAIGVMLPTAKVVVGPTSSAVATVDAVADESGEIAGDVIDTAGDVVGTVTGRVSTPPVREAH